MSSTRGAAARHEKRAHPRVAVEIAVSCERRDGPALFGTVRDISIGGTFVESTELLPFGTAVVIVARLPHTKTDLRLPGVVRWAKPNGFGVQFTSLGARETHAIVTGLM
ncbi:MAG TPA: PilZ domain-containing protein [Polyangiaceae bacterium]|jgi:Tfp pilus assembly protein PilZ